MGWFLGMGFWAFPKSLWTFLLGPRLFALSRKSRVIRCRGPPSTRQLGPWRVRCLCLFLVKFRRVLKLHLGKIQVRYLEGLVGRILRIRLFLLRDVLLSFRPLWCKIQLCLKVSNKVLPFIATRSHIPLWFAPISNILETYLRPLFHLFEDLTFPIVRVLTQLPLSPLLIIHIAARADHFETSFRVHQWTYHLCFHKFLEAFLLPLLGRGQFLANDKAKGLLKPKFYKFYRC